MSEHSFFSYSLHVWDDASARLLRITDKLFFDYGQRDSFYSCATPRVPYSMAVTSSEGHLFFAEVSEDFTTLEMFLMRSDLSSPPRSLGAVAVDRCIPAYVSQDKSRVAVLQTWAPKKPIPFGSKQTCFVIM